VELDMKISERLSIEEARAEVQPSSDIFVVEGTTGKDGGFNALMGLMGDKGLPFHRSKRVGQTFGPGGLIQDDAAVILKVNSQWDERGETNTDLAKEIIEAILTHPDGFKGEVVVADNGQAQFGAHGSGGGLDWELNNAEDTAQSMQDVVNFFDSRRVSTYLWDLITTKRVREYSKGDLEDGYVVEDAADPVTGIKVSYPKFRTEFGTYVSFKHGVWNPDSTSYNSENLKILNVPVLKTHRIYGVTACLKHYMGVTSDKLTERNAHSSVGKGGMGTQMAKTRIPTLNILDAIWVNAKPGKGPRTNYEDATRLNILMASVDPVALDHWASKNVLMQTAQLKGYEDPSEMDPDNDKPGSFGDWLKISMGELRKAGHTITANPERMNVYSLDTRT
jgi:uncharacterized protein (DUF362 family)